MVPNSFNVTGLAIGTTYDHDNDPDTAPIAHPGGSDIILANNERLQEKLAQRFYFTLKTYYDLATEKLTRNSALIHKPSCRNMERGDFKYGPTVFITPVNKQTFSFDNSYLPGTSLSTLLELPSIYNEIVPKSEMKTILGVSSSVWVVDSDFRIANSTNQMPGIAKYLAIVGCAYQKI